MSDPAAAWTSLIFWAAEIQTWSFMTGMIARRVDGDRRRGDPAVEAHRAGSQTEVLTRARPVAGSEGNSLRRSAANVPVKLPITRPPVGAS